MRRYYLWGVRASLSIPSFKSDAAETFLGEPEKSGATTGNGGASVGPRARCVTLTRLPRAQMTLKYMQLTPCCLARTCEDIFIFISAII